jgi:hypothetical protein
MFEPAYEKRLLAEYEGDGALLRQMTGEFNQCRREMYEAGYPLTVRLNSAPARLAEIQPPDILR